MSYDHANRVTRVTNPATGETVGRYHYDDQGFRVRKTALTDDGVDRKETMLLYASMYFGVEIQKDVYTGEEIYTVLNNIYLNGVRVAAMVPTGEAAHFHTDQVDSVKVVTNDAGAVVSRMEYLPYGESWFREGDDRFAPKYNSQELDRESGYYFYNARHYDPEICRFVTANSRIPDDMNTQGWNRFTYVINNPILYLDPTGHEWYQKREQEELASGKYLQVDFKVNEGKDRSSQQRWYTDNPAEDLKTVTGNNISRAKWTIGEKSANITKWTNPAEKFGRVTTIDDPVITKGRNYQRDHNAIDEISSSGGGKGIDKTDLISGGSGRVSFTKDIYGGKGPGKYVEIDLGDGRTRRLLHSSEIDVKTGQWVNMNTLIGKAGNTGSPGGSHVHEEWYIRDQKTPMPIGRSISERNDGKAVFPGNYVNPNCFIKPPLQEQK